MASSIPCSDFLHNGFPYAPLEADRAVDFALEYWHLKRDVFEKDATIAKLRAQLRDSKVIDRKHIDHIQKLKQDVSSRDETIINMEARLVLAQEAVDKEKQNTDIKGKASARGRLVASKLKAQLEKKAEEVKDLETKV
jgi:tetrahydromethanopterin S-methyltransferase subunit A